MHAVSSLYGSQNFLRSVESMKIEICRVDCSFKDYPSDEDMFHLCMELISECNLDMSDDVFVITDLYLRLRQLINDGLRE